MPWRSSKPASAVATIWGYFPLAAWEAFAAGAVHLSASPSRLNKLERHKFFRMCTYEKCACKSPGMRTYEIIGLKVSWNEYLQKNPGGPPPSLPPCSRSPGWGVPSDTFSGARLYSLCGVAFADNWREQPFTQRAGFLIIDADTGR